MSFRKIISIDPAPGKKSTVFDGRKFRDHDAPSLRSLLAEIQPGTLVCWDAPLTGPRDPEFAGEEKDFTQRRIDSFFAREKTGFRTPKGISVLPYGGCPHWTITRSLLGLPRVGPYDRGYGDLPFRLLPPDDEIGDPRPAVVEIHPAVAIWLWCKQYARKSWLYKKDADLRERLSGIICRETGFPSDGELREAMIASDDKFDAAVGYILGSLYVTGGAAVDILGTRETGAMLLPLSARLYRAWNDFVSQTSDPSV